ncbi:Mov34/MPN/PAD-1 family protein [Pseudomonas helleri]|uniref:Mov34/MPN/PAD-1 family protein n=1 Tax=Pseudomonas helleri TaxID=1608996 RepID=UPI0037C561B4
MERNNSPLRYQIPGASWCLEFPESVVLQLAAYAQWGSRSLEGVGQLYTRDLTASSVTVDCVTKVAPAWAKYTAVRLDMKAVKQERAAMFKKGLHCIGFWHSHPESRPHVSPTDLIMAEEQARAGKSDYQGLVFMIIGNVPPPNGFGVWVHDGDKLWRADSIPG